MKVCKFGGSSLADAGQVAKVCDIIVADPDRRIVVVSAPGKRDKGDTKVTDLLIACAERKIEEGKALAVSPSPRPSPRGGEGGECGSALEALEVVIARYAEIQEALGVEPDVVDSIRADLEERLATDFGSDKRFMDAMKAAGEDNSARLVAAVLNARGSKARYVSPKEAGMVLSDDYGNAAVLPESYDNLANVGDFDGITVFPGFFGYTRDGAIATFPRGGSDITGSILAAAVKADVYENFTDVDSVCSADPRLVPDVDPIPEITYREMRELAYAGFGVLHDEAIIPAVHAGIPICIKNTNGPEAPGTRIVLEREHEHGRAVGVAASDGFCTINVSKYLMNREIGFGRRLLQIFEEEGLSYEHMPSGIDDVSVIVREESFSPEAETKVLGRIKDDLGADSVGVERGLALVMIVGQGMHYTVGMAAKATKALAEAGINIEMINQGASEISMMFGVKAEDREKAVKALYGEFFK